MPRPRPGRLVVNLQIAGFLALPGVVIVAQKTFYDTLYAYKGWPRPKQESQSFPSGGAELPSFSLLARASPSGSTTPEETERN